MKRKKLFHIENSGDNKRIFIATPSDELRLEVDNDDVFEGELLPMLDRVLAILNDHWNDTEYAHFVRLPEIPDDDDGEKAYEASRKYEAGLVKRWK